MEFEIIATSVDEFDHSKPLTKLLVEYPCLKDFGLECRNIGTYRIERIRDENGKFIQQRTPRPYYKDYVTIDTLEQLIQLQKAVNNELVITEERIEIYDTYRE